MLHAYNFFLFQDCRQQNTFIDSAIGYVCNGGS